MTDDEEGKRVAERLGDFDWSRLQAVMLEGLADAPHHRLDMEAVGTVSTLGYKVNLAEWDAKRDAAKRQLEKGVDDQEVAARTIMAWQMPANLPSRATFLQWIKELIKIDCEGSEGDRVYKGDEIAEVSLDTARRAPHQPYGKILCRDGDVGERLFWQVQGQVGAWSDSQGEKGTEGGASCQGAGCGGEGVGGCGDGGVGGGRGAGLATGSWAGPGHATDGAGGGGATGRGT